MKRLLTLWITLANEEARGCRTSATMDIKTVQWRVKHEGLSFLGITLADFGKAFERSLDQGHVALTSFSSWKSRGGLPLFLRGFLEQVFDSSSGVLFEEPSIDSIRAIRQLTLMFGKIEIPCSDARVADAFHGYLECEKDVRECDNARDPIDLEDFVRVSHLLLAPVLSKVDSDVYHGRIVPRHGPGATSDRLIGNEKFGQNTWPARLNEVFPVWENLISNYRFTVRLEEVDILEPGAEIPVRVITVPKTLKGPRIIGMEPTSMQYMQQGLQRPIYDYVESDTMLRRMIGFLTQVPNQELARKGSLTGDLATLDLSEASDRVSNQLVRAMLLNYPHLSGAVDATRSRRARVPGHDGIIRLAKFASMGSALCFPMEAMVFLTIIFIGIERELNTRFRSRKDFLPFVSQVRVFGDDLIIPKEYVQSVTLALETFGSRVNEHKSFWTGRFRESCGKEYYDGQDVSIVKVRAMPPTSLKDATGIASYVSLRNQLYYAGLWDAVKLLDEDIRKLIKHFPVVSPTSPVLGRHSFLGYETQELSEDTHAPLVKGYVLSPKIPVNEVDGPDALLKFHLRSAYTDLRREEGCVDHDGHMPSIEGHLRRSGRPYAVDIKLRKASPF